MSHYQMLSALTSAPGAKSGESTPCLVVGNETTGAKVWAWTVSSEECRYSGTVWEIIVHNDSNQNEHRWTAMTCTVQDDGLFHIGLVSHNVSEETTIGHDLRESAMINLFDAFVTGLHELYP